MIDENVGGFEEWFAAQWGIGGHRQIALSAWNAALSAHRQPVVDEAMVERLAKYIYQQEAGQCRTLEAYLHHIKGWPRALPEARAMLTAALKGADHE